MPIRGLGILLIWNFRILTKKIATSCQSKNSSSYTFLLSNLTDMTSNQESVYMKTPAQIPMLTSLPLTLTAKKSLNITFSADKIYYNFSHEHPKISNMQNTQTPDRHFNVIDHTKNYYHFSVCVYCNRWQKTSQHVKNKKYHTRRSRVGWLLFFTRCDVFCDLLQYTHTEKWSDADPGCRECRLSDSQKFQIKYVNWKLCVIR